MVAREEGLDAAVELTERRGRGHVVVLEGADTFSLGREHALELRNDGIGVVVAPRQGLVAASEGSENPVVVVARAFLEHNGERLDVGLDA
jgi:ketol-acid reductoisomerase